MKKGSFTPTQDLVKVEQVSFSYHKRGQKTLDKVSFTLAAGSSLGVVGSSGCGKSTLARLCAGILTPSEGRILIEDEPLKPLGWRARPLEWCKRVQLLFQNPFTSCNPMRGVASSLAELIALHQRSLNSKERYEAALIAMQEVGLGQEKAEQLGRELSGGERQRLQLARALVAEPKLLICDEMLSALDPPMQMRLLDLLKSLQEQRSLSLLFIGHDLETVRHLCNRIAVMQQGAIVDLFEVEEWSCSGRCEVFKRLVG